MSIEEPFATNVFQKIGQYRPLLCLFSFYAHYNNTYSFNLNCTHGKMLVVVLGIRTPGRMMVGAGLQHAV